MGLKINSNSFLNSFLNIYCKDIFRTYSGLCDAVNVLIF